MQHTEIEANLVRSPMGVSSRAQDSEQVSPGPQDRQDLVSTSSEQFDYSDDSDEGMDKDNDCVMERQTDRQTNRLTDRLRDRETKRQRDRETERQREHSELTKVSRLG